MKSTVDRIRKELTENGLVRRYRREIYGRTEGTFLICTFWLIENLVMQRRLEEAEVLFERAAGCASDLGLLPEEFDPRRRLFLGNFPQAFSHLALPWVSGSGLDPFPEGERQRPRLATFALPFQGGDAPRTGDPGYLKNGTLGYLALSLRDKQPLVLSNLNDLFFATERVRRFRIEERK